jgi:hypothetical protein
MIKPQLHLVNIYIVLTERQQKIQIVIDDVKCDVTKNFLLLEL